MAIDIKRLHISFVRREWLESLSRPRVVVAEFRKPGLGTFLTFGWRHFRLNIDWLPW